MSNGIKILSVLVGVVVVLALWLTGIFNKMVVKDETVKTQWSEVENKYQQRYDLIPNLVETVKGYAAHEKNTLESVIEARAKATSLNVDVKDAKALAEFQSAQSGISSALSRLMVVVEKYPDLKASQSFRDLNVSLEGTENRIAFARKNYNESVKDYNTYIRKFPNAIAASLFSFTRATLFEATQGAEVAPVVSFE